MTPGVTLVQAIVSAVVGTLWLGVAGLIVAQATGMTDISPMSGMALMVIKIVASSLWSWLIVVLVVVALFGV